MGLGWRDRILFDPRITSGTLAVGDISPVPVFNPDRGLLGNVAEAIDGRIPRPHLASAAAFGVGGPAIRIGSLSHLSEVHEHHNK